MFRSYSEILVDEAVALWEMPSQNYLLVDGNKCTAFAATFVFLAINGFDATVSDGDSRVFLLDLYDIGAVVFANLQSWLLDNTT